MAGSSKGILHNNTKELTTNGHTAWMNLTNIILSTRSQIYTVHFSLYKGQNEAKLIHYVRSQESGYPWRSGREHKEGFLEGVSHIQFFVLCTVYCVKICSTSTYNMCTFMYIYYTLIKH